MPPPSHPRLTGASSSSPPIGSSSSPVPSTRWPAKWVDEITLLTLNKVEFSRMFFEC